MSSDLPTSGGSYWRGMLRRGGGVAGGGGGGGKGRGRGGSRRRRSRASSLRRPPPRLASVAGASGESANVNALEQTLLDPEEAFRARVRRLQRAPPPPPWWSVALENSFRLALAGYEDEQEYLRVRSSAGGTAGAGGAGAAGGGVERWPVTGLIKKLARRSDGCWYYFGEGRECPDVDAPAAAAWAAAGSARARWRRLPLGRLRLSLLPTTPPHPFRARVHQGRSSSQAGEGASGSTTVASEQRAATAAQ